jgi:hypothetical protein
MAVKNPQLQLNQISAADNLVIETNQNTWRMLVNTNFVDNIQGDGIILEALPGQPLRYTPLFARTRRLPKNGVLAVNHIQRVVLGWSWEDEAWHLGLLLEDRLAQARGSRWCEVAKWPDPEQDLYQELAVQAGEALARNLGRPFNLVPLRDPGIETLPVNVPLPSLPLALQEWRLGRSQGNGWLVFVRAPYWARERTRRMIWYGFWSVIYVLLSVVTLLTDISPPRPDFLPYVGLGTAVLLVGLVGYSAYELRTTARRVILDPATRRVWGTTTRGNKPIWRKGREEVDSVYVTEVVDINLVETDNDEPETNRQPVATDIFYGELNLRLTDGTFYYLLRQEEAETITEPIYGVLGEVQALERGMLTTRLQAAGAYVAEALDVPLWYDCRPK